MAEVKNGAGRAAGMVLEFDTPEKMKEFDPDFQRFVEENPDSGNEGISGRAWPEGCRLSR